MRSMTSSVIRNVFLNNEQGMFYDLCALRLKCGDTTLSTHLRIAPKNCTIISLYIKNEVIEAIGSVTGKKISTN